MVRYFALPWRKYPFPSRVSARLAAGADAIGTVRSYRGGVFALLDAWTGQDLLRPDPDAATLYVRQLERQGLAPTPIQARVAAGRGLDAGLRWCRAGTMDPFAHGRVPHAPPPAWDKRLPYAEDEVAALLQAAMDPADYVLILLGAHAGLRAPEQECGNVRWAEVPRARRDRVVRCGKGGKQRIVALSATHLTARLAGRPWRADG